MLADDAIDAVDTGTDEFNFGQPGNPAGDLPHGVDTGGQVVYDAPGEFEDANGNDVPNPNDLGGLDNGRSYLVIADRAATTLRLGVEFTGAVVEPDFAGSSFAIGHLLETGDMSPLPDRHRAPASRAHAGNVYRVVKVDAFRIKLAPSAPRRSRTSRPTRTSTTRRDPDVDRHVVEAGDDTFCLPGHGFEDDQAVTYHSPTPATFTSRWPTSTSPATAWRARSSTAPR